MGTCVPEWDVSLNKKGADRQASSKTNLAGTLTKIRERSERKKFWEHEAFMLM